MLYHAMNEPYCSSSDARCVLAAMRILGLKYMTYHQTEMVLFSAVVFQLLSIGLQPMLAHEAWGDHNYIIIAIKEIAEMLENTVC